MLQVSLRTVSTSGHADTSLMQALQRSGKEVLPFVRQSFFDPDLDYLRYAVA